MGTYLPTHKYINSKTNFSKINVLAYRVCVCLDHDHIQPLCPGHAMLYNTNAFLWLTSILCFTGFSMNSQGYRYQFYSIFYAIFERTESNLYVSVLLTNRHALLIPCSNCIVHGTGTHCWHMQRIYISMPSRELDV